MIDGPVVGAYAVTLGFTGVSLFAEAKFNDRRVDIPPREEWERVFGIAKEEASEDMDALREKSLASVARSVLESIFILAVLLRTGVHSIAHLLGSGGKEPDWIEFGLVRHPVGPRPLWNDVSARVTVATLALWWHQQLPTLDPSLDPRLQLLVLAWLGGNAAILYADPLIPVFEQVRKHWPTIGGNTLTNRS